MWRRKVFRRRTITKKTRFTCSEWWSCLCFCMEQRRGKSPSRDSEDYMIFRWSTYQTLLEWPCGTKKQYPWCEAETEEVPMEDQLRLKWLQWFGHLQRMSDHQPQVQVLKCCPLGKKGKPGGTSLWISYLACEQRPVQDCQLGTTSEGQEPVVLYHPPALPATQPNLMMMKLWSHPICPTMDKECGGEGVSVCERERYLKTVFSQCPPSSWACKTTVCMGCA